MAAIDYPHTPILGEEHTDDDGITWICENATGPVWGPKLTREQLAALNIELEASSVVDVKIYIPSIHDTIYDGWIKHDNLNFPEVSAFVLEANLLTIYDMTSAVPVVVKTIVVINGTKIKVLNGVIFISSSTVGLLNFNIKENYVTYLEYNDLFSSLAIRDFDIAYVNESFHIIVATADEIYHYAPGISDAITGYSSGAYTAGFLSDQLIMGSNDARRLFVGESDEGAKLITDGSLLNFTESSVPAILQGAGWVENITKIEDNHLIASITNPPALLHLWVEFDEQYLSSLLHITHEYYSGLMHGDCIGAFLANSAIADRSPRGNGLTEIGTLTEEPIVTGSDIMCYSGFTDTDYLIQAYNADFNLTLDDYYDQDVFCIDVWVYRDAYIGNEYIFRRADADGSPSMSLYVNTSSKYVFTIDGVSMVADFTSTLNKWELIQISVINNSNSWMTMHVNGVRNHETYSTPPDFVDITSVDNSGKLTIGRSYQEAGNAYPFGGKIALLRFSKARRDISTYTQTGSVTHELEKLVFNNENVKTLIQDDNTNIKYIDYDENDEIASIITDTAITKYTKIVVADSRTESIDSISSVVDKELVGVVV